MDPLSVTASIVAVLQLSVKVLSYLNDVKDASKDRTACVIELSNLYSLLVSLRSCLEGEDTSQLWYTAVRALAVEHGPLDQFKQALESLQARLAGRGRMKKAGKALNWILKKEELASILAQMERLKTLVAIALQMDHLKLSQAIIDDTDFVLRPTSLRDQDSARHRGLLEWVSASDYPAQQSDIVQRQQKGTGQWFLEAPDVAQWLHEDKATLFCPGIPGAGKTVLAAIMINYLLNTAQNSSHGVAYVYCNYKSQEEQDAQSMLAAILKQLVQGRMSTVEHVERLYQKHADRGTKPIFPEIISVVKEVLAHYSSVYIVIDALDECQIATRQQILATLEDLKARYNIHLMVTARLIPDIDVAFRGATRVEIRARREDIKRFVVGQTYRLPACIQRSKTLQEMVQEQIATAADGMFLVACLYLNLLLDKSTSKAVKEALARITTGSGALAFAYEEALQRIENQLAGHRKLARETLSWVALAKRPLTSSEICYALAVDPDETEIDLDDVFDVFDVEDLVSVCAGLIVFEPESATIRFAHGSIQEYFEHISYGQDSQTQQRIASTCFTYLSFEAFRSGSCSTDEEFQARLVENPFLNYAASYWHVHARATEVEVSDLALRVLENDDLVSVIVQVTTASGQAHKGTGYSQRYPKETKGLHLTTRYGLLHLSEKLLAKPRVLENIKDNPKDQYGRTPLSYAAEQGHWAVLSLLVEQGITEVESKDQNGRTPLSYAAEQGHWAVLSLLVEQGITEVDSRDQNGRTPLSWATANGHEAVVKLLLDSVEKLEIDSRDQDGRTPLSWAAANGHEAVVKLLLDPVHRVNIDSRDHNGRTPLWWATNNGHETVVKLLLNLIEKVEIDLRDQDGRTPLSRAAANGHKSVVKLLLDSLKVEIDSRDQDGQTPLWWAATHGHVPVVELLLFAGEPRIGSQEALLSWAFDHGHWGVIELLLHQGEIPLSPEFAIRLLLASAEVGHTKVVGLLLKQSTVTADSRNEKDRTVLSHVAERGELAICQLLLRQKDVLVGSQDCNGRTPLSWAAESGQEEIVQELLGCSDAKVDCRDNCGQTPLSWAARSGHTKVVRLLLHQANVTTDLRDKNQRTILSHTAERGHLAVCQLLLRQKDVLVGSQDCNGRTPLSWAAESGQEEIIQELVSRSDAKVDCRDNCGRTAVHYAAKSGHTETACILLEQADVSISDSENNTALLTALEINHVDVVRLLIGKDNTALHTLTRRGRWDQIKILLDEGYHIDTRDSRNSTALHEAVRSKSTLVLAQLIYFGADVNLCDMEGMSPLHLAVELHDRKAIEQLLDSPTALAGIKAKKWRDAYNNESGILVISEGGKQGYSVKFEGQFDWPVTQPRFLGKRLLVLKTNPPLLKKFSAPHAHGMEIRRQKHNDRTDIYSVRAWFFAKQDIDHKIVQDWECCIGWTMSQRKSPDGRQCWKPVDHFSMLPHGWIPKNGTDFFQQFLSHLEDNWQSLCNRAHERLSELRRDVLVERGKSVELIANLLEHARLWAELRQSLERQIEEARRFNEEYCSRFREETNTDLGQTISRFAKSVTKQIDRLDEISQSLIQTEFSLVSINEARRSTSTSTSMKRLSWVTFIFLPAMFASSLFGMNVDILKTNPDWRWFILFGGALLVLTIMGWLLFKYCRIEGWVEKHIGRRLENWLRGMLEYTLPQNESRRTLPRSK